MTFAVDEVIERLAATQLGLVTRGQLRECGIADHVIERRVRTHRLRQVHRGVYRVGPLVAPRSHELAAVLACGPHAVLSHRSAGALWQLLPEEDNGAGPNSRMKPPMPGVRVKHSQGLPRVTDSPIDVSVSQGNRGRRPNIRLHRVSLTADDVTTLDGIPVTSAGRTVRDLAALLSIRELERVLAQAERLQYLEKCTLQSLAAGRTRRPGAPLLRALLQHDAEPALTRSEAEERFLGLIRKAQLPVPETNVLVDEYELDFLWRRERLVVEVDGFAYHSSRHHFETDRRRDARLTARGLSVMRVTWRQVVDEPEAMVARLAQSLVRMGNALS